MINCGIDTFFNALAKTPLSVMIDGSVFISLREILLLLLLLFQISNLFLDIIHLVLFVPQLLLL